STYNATCRHIQRLTRQVFRRPTRTILWLHPPPESTLFPYTTLFRSRVTRDPVGLRRARRGVALRGGECAAIGPRFGQDFPGDVEDRKSTRLNSSHVKISYAVFCSKKKTPDEFGSRWWHPAPLPPSNV